MSRVDGHDVLPQDGAALASGTAFLVAALVPTLTQDRDSDPRNPEPFEDCLDTPKSRGGRADGDRDLQPSRSPCTLPIFDDCLEPVGGEQEHPAHHRAAVTVESDGSCWNALTAGRPTSSPALGEETSDEADHVSVRWQPPLR